MILFRTPNVITWCEFWTRLQYYIYCKYYIGEEALLKDKWGNLPVTVREEPFISSSHTSYRHRIEVIQNAKEIIFVPSGWHHEVQNLVIIILFLLANTLVNIWFVIFLINYQRS